MNSDAVSGRTVTTHDGLRLFVRCHGRWNDTDGNASARLPVLCLPGLTRTGDDFDVLAQTLATDPLRPRRVAALDYRGRGRSDYDSNPANYSLPIEAADVLTVMAALDIAPAVLIGTSRGGLIALVLAMTRPEVIAGVVFNDIGPVVDMPGLMRIKSYVGKMGEPRDFGAAAGLLRSLFADQFPKLTDADWLVAAHRGFREENGRLVPTYDPALARTLDDLDPAKPPPSLWDGFDALADKPLMTIRGANSDILSPATLAEMQARRPDLDNLIVPDQGHPPLMVEPDVIGRIAAFVARCDEAISNDRRQSVG
ncbi:MAG TPA: alpha/beta hydrolase [Pseudolabrys sp.]|nr:alpha/beta hydrolase [Pseudolabrys sp.]